MAQIVPTIKVRLSAYPKVDRTANPMASEDYEEPLVELVSVEEIVNSQPAITAAVNDFIKRYRSQGIRTGQVSIVRVS